MSIEGRRKKLFHGNPEATHAQKALIATGETVIFGVAGMIYPPALSVAAVTAGAAFYETVLHLRSNTVDESRISKDSK